ncbi:MAG: peptidylprolyl isomerase [Bacteroidia bacterium]
MKTNNIWLILLLGFFAISSCKKDDDTEPIITPDPTDTIPDEKFEVININTTNGDIWIWLYDTTAQHKANFLKLAGEGFYDSTTFHRIIDGFMIQGGDPNSKDSDTTNDGTGGPGYTIPAEFVSTLTHVQGAVAAARQPDSVNPQKESSGSQFYIVENESGTPHLDENYTIFGQVMAGINVVETIAIQPKNQANNRPYADIKMTVKVAEKTEAELKTEFGWDIPQ